MKKIAIAGAGFSGCIIASELAKIQKYKIDIFEKRSHIGGNCYSERDKQTNVMVHVYGPHIFNTSKKEIWDYISHLTPMKPYINRVKAVTAKGEFPLPVNLRTINLFFDKNFTPEEAKLFLTEQSDATIVEPKTFEEQALKFIGHDLYKNFFYGYTKKQWGVEPKELPASILKRIPVRFTDDDNYYNSLYQGIPEFGYTPIFEKLIAHDAITVHYNSDFPQNLKKYDYIFYTGPLDAYFDYEFGQLPYRSLMFEKNYANQTYQSNAVVNYCEEKIPYTRISEHKHFAPWETHEKTVYFKEYSKQATKTDIPFYPIRMAQDKSALDQYVEKAQSLSNVTFVGRLATYRYLDMDQVIAEALQVSQKCLATPMDQWPRFPEPVAK
ncbi:MAG: UDP-galactopyranose mutase [Bdellovibrionales bacterium]|nr:UDP-galactopyranose mutase [Bdellovibrionales bacterium]